MTEEDLERISEIIAEHNKSLSLLHTTLSDLVDSHNDQRTRLAEMEAKLAYYVDRVENNGRILS